MKKTLGAALVIGSMLLTAVPAGATVRFSSQITNLSGTIGGANSTIQGTVTSLYTPCEPNRHVDVYANSPYVHVGSAVTDANGNFTARTSQALYGTEPIKAVAKKRYLNRRHTKLCRGASAEGTV